MAKRTEEKKPENSNAEFTERQGRRMDSIAWLVQGDAKCGAACFDGQKLLLATNKQISLATPVKELLINIASTAIDLRQAKTKEEINKVQRKIDGSIDNFTKAYTTIYTKFEKKINRRKKEEDEGYKYSILNPKDGGEYLKRFNRAIEKVIDSIIAAAVNPASDRAIPSKLFEAIRNKSITIIEGQETKDSKGNDIHAEMQVLQRLMTEPLQANAKPYYIGVSKLCCIKCEAVIDAVNEVLGDKVKTRPLSSTDSKNYDYQGHGGAFHNTGIPRFILKANEPLNATKLAELQNDLIKQIQHYFKEETWREKDTLNNVECVFSSLEAENVRGQHYRKSESPEHTGSSSSSTSKAPSKITRFSTLTEWVDQKMPDNWSISKGAGRADDEKIKIDSATSSPSSSATSSFSSASSTSTSNNTTQVPATPSSSSALSQQRKAGLGMFSSLPPGEQTTLSAISSASISSSISSISSSSSAVSSNPSLSSISSPTSTFSSLAAPSCHPSPPTQSRKRKAENNTPDTDAAQPSRPKKARTEQTAPPPSSSSTSSNASSPLPITGESTTKAVENAKTAIQQGSVASASSTTINSITSNPSPSIIPNIQVKGASSNRSPKFC
jgi:hypothetical protein